MILRSLIGRYAVHIEALKVIKKIIKLKINNLKKKKRFLSDRND